ncbi:MAG: biopolymer transporter ExbD [Flavobacteriales bacterium]|jgi:biopolymer transport protein ExbD|nr:biopolymer transporter ExbD [Flavobacteriales bacterium]
MLKKRKRQGIQEINAGSMADIAFLLLIFFLVTTTMDTDAGILRLLPPVVEEEVDMQVNKRDVYEVLVNDADMLLVEGEVMEIKDLRAGAKEFMTNPSNDINLPERRRVTSAECQQKIGEFKSYVASATDPEAKDAYQKSLEKWEEKLEAVKLLGDFSELPPNAVISLQTGSKTSYDMYVRVQNELEAGIRELRDELSKEKFGRKYTELDEKKDEDKALIKAVRLVYPQRVSEAEPVDVTKKS